MALVCLANQLWRLANTGRWWRFDQALKRPRQTQAALLGQLLGHNAQTVYGRRYGFASIRSIQQYQQRVPITTYDDYSSFIDQIRQGGQRVLTRDPVGCLVPSSGSASAYKLIPYTRRLQAQFNRGIGPWIVDLFARHPQVRRGPAYWSISPNFSQPKPPRSSVPIGFDDDSAYLGGVAKRLVAHCMAVPPSVRHIQEIDHFRYVTLVHLLRAAKLRLISVWHPTFLSLLLEPMQAWWDRLVYDIEKGTLNPTNAGGDTIRHGIVPPPSADPVRAGYLRHINPADYTAIWPKLKAVSCWADAGAGHAARELAIALPGVAIEPKGLIATEAIVTLPFQGARPMAVCSHFFELIDGHGHANTMDQAVQGQTYRVVITTAGGLYRYDLQDRVVVDGWLGGVPTLRFVGKEDRISDLRGEKLSEGFVANVFNETLASERSAIQFAMLAPDHHNDGTIGYTLFLQSTHRPAPDLIPRIQQGLRKNPHYAYCVALAQLNPARLFLVEGNAHQAYLKRVRELGQPLGGIKPTALSNLSGWRDWFKGQWSDKAGVISEIASR